MSSKFGAKIIKFRHLCKFFDIFLHFFAFYRFTFLSLPLHFYIPSSLNPNLHIVIHA